jgi:hypothetical protein
METNSLLKAEMMEIFSSEIDKWLAKGHKSNDSFSSRRSLTIVEESKYAIISEPSLASVHL